MLIRKYTQIYGIKFRMFTIYRKLTKFYAAYKFLMYIIVMEQTYSDTGAGNKIEVCEFLEPLGLLDNEVSPVNMDNDDINESDINEKDSDDDQDNYWDP